MFLRTLSRFAKKREGYLLALALALFFAYAMASDHGEFKAEGKRGWVKFYAQRGYVEVEGRGKLWMRTGIDAKAEINGTFATKAADGDMDLYRDFNGKVKVSGLNFRVEFRGEGIKFHSEGIGKASMRGEGTFTVNDGPANEWGKDYHWAHCRF